MWQYYLEIGLNMLAIVALFFLLYLAYLSHRHASERKAVEEKYQEKMLRYQEELMEANLMPFLKQQYEGMNIEEEREIGSNWYLYKNRSFMSINQKLGDEITHYYSFSFNTDRMQYVFEKAFPPVDHIAMMKDFWTAIC